MILIISFIILVKEGFFEFLFWLCWVKSSSELKTLFLKNLLIVREYITYEISSFIIRLCISFNVNPKLIIFFLLE